MTIPEKYRLWLRSQKKFSEHRCTYRRWRQAHLRFREILTKQMREVIIPALRSCLILLSIAVVLILLKIIDDTKQ